MASANETTIRRHFAEFWNKGNVVAELFTADYIGHGASVPDFNAVSLKQVVGSSRTSFPDMRATIEDVIEGGDKVVVRYNITGTHKGSWKGVAPSGKAVKGSAVGIYRMVDGKIAESWALTDDLGVMRQVGGVPALAPATP
jgi:predicted ester cyclase